MSQSKSIRIARKLRKNQTPIEALLWHLLRNRRLYDFKFRRQFPVGKYVADFCCFDKKLVVELDGGQHNVPNSPDITRDEYLRKEGYTVIRIWNNELIKNQDAVLEKIYSTLKSL